MSTWMDLEITVGTVPYLSMRVLNRTWRSTLNIVDKAILWTGVVDWIKWKKNMCVLCKCAYMYIYMYVCKRAYIDVYIYIYCEYVCVCCMYVCIGVCVLNMYKKVGLCYCLNTIICTFLTPCLYIIEDIWCNDMMCNLWKNWHMSVQMMWKANKYKTGHWLKK